MAMALKTICPCGHELTALALGREDGSVQEIIDITPKKCLHAFLELRKQIR